MSATDKIRIDALVEEAKSLLQEKNKLELTHAAEIYKIDKKAIDNEEKLTDYCAKCIVHQNIINGTYRTALKELINKGYPINACSICFLYTIEGFNLFKDIDDYDN